MSIPYRERQWTDVEPRNFDKSCLEVSKLMIRLLRHDESIHRQGDGAVRFEDLASTLRSKIRTWLSFLQRGGGDTKIFQYCLTPAHLNIYHTFEQFKVIQEAPLLILHCKTTYCCQTTSSSTSITLGTLTTCTPSFSRGWFREAEVLRKIDKRCSSQRRLERRSWFRPESAQDCSVQEYLEKSPKYSIWV